MSLIDLLDVDVKRSVLSASLIMVILFGLTLLSKVVTIILLIAFAGLSVYMLFELYVKERIGKNKKSGYVEIQAKGVKEE